MLRPFNIFLMFRWLRQQLFSLLLRSNNFATVMTPIINIWQTTPVKGLFDLPKWSTHRFRSTVWCEGSQRTIRMHACVHCSLWLQMERDQLLQAHKPLPSLQEGLCFELRAQIKPSFLRFLLSESSIMAMGKKLVQQLHSNPQASLGCSMRPCCFQS